MNNWEPRHKGQMLSSGFFLREIHYSDNPDRDDIWVAAENPKYGGVNTPKWQREQEINWDIYGGERVWPMLNRQLHNQRVVLNEDWAIYRIIDHGIRHPTCCLWVAVNRNGDRHFYREYYATDKTIALNSREIIRLSPEIVLDTYIDPSTLSRINYQTTDPSADKKGLTARIDIYIENGINCSLADNSSAGYDKVTDGLLATLARYAIRTGQMPSYLQEMKINQEQLLLLASKPAITFDLRFTQRSFHEIENLRWKDLTGDETQRSKPEKTVDVADEGPDCVRYAVQSELFWRRPPRRIPFDSYLGKLTRRGSMRQYKQLKKWA